MGPTVSLRRQGRSEKSIQDTYKLLGLAGTGQYGRVYCARRISTGELVALKELLIERFSTQNLLRELRYLLALDHENITRCEALEHAKEGRYLVLEYCEGGTLRDLITLRTPLSYAQILQFMREILAGLAHAHAQGLVHCDVKPENILLKPNATGWTLKLTDFGIARHQDRVPGEFSATGSPAYMAPERFYGEISPASDLYAVGIILYEMLTTHRPFSGSPPQLMQAHLNQRVILEPEIPMFLRPILEGALRKLPARRFRSATGMAAALEAAARQLVEPQHCWLGQILPLAIPPLQHAQPLSVQVSVLRPPLDPSDPRFAWTDQHKLYHNSLETITPAAIPLRQFPHPITDLYSLSDNASLQGVDHLTQEWQDHLVITTHAAYRLSGGRAPQPLLQVSPHWQHVLIPTHGWLAWASATEWGLVDLKRPWRHNSSSPPDLEGEKPADLDYIYRWPLPSPGKGGSAQEVPHLAWLQSLRSLALVSSHGQSAATLWLYPNFSPAQITPDSLETYDLPVPARQLVPGWEGRTLLLSDPVQLNRLTLIQVQPFRLRSFFLHRSVTQIVSAPWGFLAVTDLGRLVLLAGSGDPLAQLEMPVGASVLRMQANGTTWIKAPWLETGQSTLTYAQAGGQQGLYLLNFNDLGVETLSEQLT